MVGRGAQGHKYSGRPGSNRSRQVSQPHPAGPFFPPSHFTARVHVELAPAPRGRSELLCSRIWMRYRVPFIVFLEFAGGADQVESPPHQWTPGSVPHLLVSYSWYPRLWRKPLASTHPYFPRATCRPGIAVWIVTPRPQSLVSFFWGTILSSAPVAYSSAIYFGTSLLTEL